MRWPQPSFTSSRYPTRQKEGQKTAEGAQFPDQSRYRVAFLTAAVRFDKGLITRPASYLVAIIRAQGL